MQIDSSKRPSENMPIEGNMSNTSQFPLVTIVTVCLNAVRTIEQTIQSVIRQTYKNIEYIIIDGGSNDGTLDIIKKYEQHITKYVSEPDEGLYDAMNKGISMAHGEYVLLLNADDSYVDDAVEIAIRFSFGVNVITSTALGAFIISE